MGLRTVAVFADADANSPFVAEADEAVRLPGGYLDGGAVVAAALATGSDAVHPGYGFLAENSSFAAAVEDAGLTWIGPSPSVISTMGDKLAAKKLAAAAGIRILPSSDDPTDDSLVGYPLLVKAAAGGGGKGMHLVEKPADLAETVTIARREATTAFGDDRVFLERYVDRSRHVEVQVLGDTYGDLVHLGLRECSIQRRHQKVVEESPPARPDPTRDEAIAAAAVNLARDIGYRSAGTVEFLVDDDSGEFFFLEVNARLQVEHPVTEEVTGIDLVREQLRVAAGEHLGYGQDDVVVNGHAIEARLYAEDPSAGFLPATGTLTAWRTASEPAVRWDSGVEEGDQVGVDFDPMLAKVVAHGSTRSDAAGQLALALERMHLGGLTTNRDFLVATLRHEAFLAGDTTTDFIERHAPATNGMTDPATLRDLAISAALWLQGRNRNEAQVLGAIPTGWRNARMPDQQVVLAHRDTRHDVRYRARRDGSFTVNGDRYALVHRWSPEDLDVEVDGLRRTIRVTAAGDRIHLTAAGTTTTFGLVPRFPVPELETPTGGLLAPMPGRILDVRTMVGDMVATGQTLLVLEAMKMEHHMTAPFNGTVTEVHVATDEQVENGTVLMVVAPTDGEQDG
tara:strand:+ start:1250 stop:3121 length:1872 start_codon:yes stop_codon:yes gene_type:complete